MPENRSAGVAVEQSPPLLQMGFLSGNAIAREPGEQQTRAKQKMHRVLVAARVGLKVVYNMVNLEPVAAIVRCGHLSSRDGSQALRIDLAEKFLSLAECFQKFLLHVDAMVRPRRKIPM